MLAPGSMSAEIDAEDIERWIAVATETLKKGDELRPRASCIRLELFVNATCTHIRSVDPIISSRLAQWTRWRAPNRCAPYKRIGLDARVASGVFATAARRARWRTLGRVTARCRHVATDATGFH